MKSRLVELGSLSDLAATYLEGMHVWSDPILEAEVARRQAENDVITAMIAIKRARTEKRPFTALEQNLLLRAEDHVRRGVQPPALFKSLARFGRRPHQTLLSLADGGEGHLSVTLRHSDLLDGAVVHHEVIARTKLDGSSDLRIPPYRMIDIKQNGIIRLHAADDVPVTVYCGRPSYQVPAWHDTVRSAWDVTEAYTADPLTASHSAAAAASAAFANSVADVKFSLDGLTVSQAIDWMRRVKASVDKRDDQFLSTQFNLNWPLRDDRQATVERHGNPVTVTDAAAIARLTVEMTRSGGWDRVTLDSASRKIPSTPLIELLGFPALVEWVHEAHAAGLETYISGGMCDQHIVTATHAGVDGVGIGFWIHYCDPSSGAVGQIDPEKIRSTIRLRNKAEASVPGVAARLLAQLDGDYASAGHLAPSCAALRQDLLQAVLSSEQGTLVPLIEQGRKL